MRSAPPSALLVTAALLLTGAATAYSAGPSDVAGNWIVEIRRGYNPVFSSRMQLEANESGEVTGKASSSTVKGRLSASANPARIELEWFPPNNPKADGKLNGTLDAATGRLNGTAEFSNGLDYTWTAYREPQKPAQPRTIDFTPTEFHMMFSASIPPALRIFPGDTVRTWSVDAGGTDSKDKRRQLGGNPLTGPFYIEGAMPGDTLAVRINKLTLNRKWAHSGAGIVSNAVSPDYTAHAQAKRAKDFSSRWTLDPDAGVATLEKPTPALKNFKVPLEPMLGCVGVAPRRTESILTGDSGFFGGNMDFNRIREGTTVYLPVSHPGALLLLGDGHAAQGDGELTGDALETSMDIDFTVDVLTGPNVGIPYAENKDELMMIGIGGSLDEALRRATTGMARYLENRHGLNPTEVAVVLGFALKYDIADLVGTQVSIVARLPKSTLAQLPAAK